MDHNIPSDNHLCACNTRALCLIRDYDRSSPLIHHLNPWNSDWKIIHPMTSLRDWILLVCFSLRYEATEGPRVNFVMREALSEIYTWILCRFIPPWETNKKNSILIFILYQNCTVLTTKYPLFNTKHPVIILRASLFVVTPSHVASWKIECQNFSYVYRSRKHWECKYL